MKLWTIISIAAVGGEEGVAECEITEDYKYYEKLIVRNRFGDVVSEEPGALTRLPNGQWWLS